MDDVIDLREVRVLREGRALLDRIDWRVGVEERWVVLGPNGSGKTTMLRVAAAELQPTSGRATVLGATFGATDLRALRGRIGVVSGAITRALDPRLDVQQVVQTGIHGTLAPWWDQYDAAQLQDVERVMEDLDLLRLRDRPYAVVSEGERQRALLARALVRDPALLLLDEPFAGLDLGARERLLVRLDDVLSTAGSAPTVLVTHHAEEIPRSCTHAALLRSGSFVAAGPIEESLTSETVSECFGLPIAVRRVGGRWAAAVREPH